MYKSDNCLWFAIRVKPKHEKNVASLFQFKNYDQFLPLYRARHRWADRIKELQLPLFPGYVFCRFDPLHRVPILNTPGVIDIVRVGQALASLDEAEIMSLQAVSRARLACEPYQYLAIGNQVLIAAGPLRGLQGILLEIKNAARLVLSVSLLQRSVLVELDNSWVEPVTFSCRS